MNTLMMMMAYVQKETSSKNWNLQTRIFEFLNQINRSAQLSKKKMTDNTTRLHTTSYDVRTST